MSMRQLPKSAPKPPSAGLKQAEYYCPHCKDQQPSVIRDNVTGDVICQNCGVVLEERYVDMHSEWRTFSNDSNSKDMNRVGTMGNQLLNDNGLTTTFSNKGPNAAAGQALHRIQMRAGTSASDKHLQRGFGQISKMAERMSLNHTISDKARSLFKQVEESGKLRGKDSHAIAVACIAIACRINGVSRTFKEICAQTRTSKNEAGKAFKAILQALDLHVKPVNPDEIIPRFCSALNLPEELSRAAILVAVGAQDKGFVAGKATASIASAAIFAVTQFKGLPTTQKEIGKYTGVSEVTVRHAYSDIEKHIDELIPDFLKDK